MIPVSFSENLSTPEYLFENDRYFVCDLNDMNPGDKLSLNSITVDPDKPLAVVTYGSVPLTFTGQNQGKVNLHSIVPEDEGEGAGAVEFDFVSIRPAMGQERFVEQGGILHLGSYALLDIVLPVSATESITIGHLVGPLTGCMIDRADSDVRDTL